MPGPSSVSLPVERRAMAISLREARKIFAFIFQLSGWALVAPSCFVLMYVRIYIVFTLHAPNHMHALTATCMHCRMLQPRLSAEQKCRKMPENETAKDQGTSVVLVPRQDSAVRSTLTVLLQCYGTKTRRSTDASTEGLGIADARAQARVGPGLATPLCHAPCVNQMPVPSTQSCCYHRSATGQVQ